MSRLVAAVVLAIFTVLTTVDAVCCPDGCTSEEQTPASTQHSPDQGACLLCLGGIDASIGHEVSPCGVAADLVRPALLSPDNVTPDPLEDPPRR